MRDYAGASAPLTIDAARSLPSSRWRVQPKMDGAYATLHTDRTGRVKAVEGRAGQPHPLALVSHIIGALVGWADSVLHGELEAYTARGEAAAERGYRQVHLFDCSRADGRRIANLPYSHRRETLWRMQSEVINFSDKSFTPVAGLKGRDERTGRYVLTMQDWRLTPIVPWVGLDEAWDRARAGETEGAVLVDLEAPLGKRGSKRKLKPVQTVDGTVVHVGRAVSVFIPGHGVLKMSRRKMEFREGDVVEIGVESGMRFPRLLRTRPDLVPVVPLRRV